MPSENTIFPTIIGTPLVERDHHVNFTDMPETVANIRRLVDESLVAGEVQQMEGPK